MHVGFGSMDYSFIVSWYILFLGVFFSFINLLVFSLVDYLQRLDIIQDLRFETATTRIKVTPDGEYLIASGDLNFQICA